MVCALRIFQVKPDSLLIFVFLLILESSIACSALPLFVLSSNSRTTALSMISALLSLLECWCEL
ncbi:unnamed protein product [Meloidogyne enterolobii]|uniref:Uncharacterized protein n=1 Tax=Meloidogyne enterolobii TaxID=390850 RepID=A0ACB0ZHA5_MELEN